jgi:solute carrier family 35 protein E1
MMQFRYPITLTIVQFGFVAFYSLLFMSPLIRFSTVRMPTRAIIAKTLPMGMFQVGGHMFSSMAISRIPVSTVHTIKVIFMVKLQACRMLSQPQALSPLFTVAAYALLYGVSYSANTYISLFPLTIGVMLACSFDVSASNKVGLLCAFGSALVFVSSNIFFKKIMPSDAGGGAPTISHKLDKLNLLLYCSVTAFILMLPIWFTYDLPRLLVTQSNPEHVAHPNHGHSTPHSVTYYFFMNGTVHFAQNLIAFVILASTSPVTYSIASLIKRVAVICIAIAWFNQAVHPVQGIGIAMTFVGLYMYNNSKGDVQRGESQMRRVEASRAVLLPSHKADMPIATTTNGGSADATGTQSSRSAYGRPRGVSSAPRYAPQPVQDPASQPHLPPPPRHQGVHSPLTHNLTIQTTPLTNPRGSAKKDQWHAMSPVDSYPSPPPSLDDSPPSETTPLPPLDYSQRSLYGHRPEGVALDSFSFPKTAHVSA